MWCCFWHTAVAFKVTQLTTPVASAPCSSNRFPAAPSEGVNLPLLLLVGKYHEFTVAQRARFAPFHNTINAPEAKVIAVPSGAPLSALPYKWDTRGLYPAALQAQNRPPFRSRGRGCVGWDTSPAPLRRGEASCYIASSPQRNVTASGGH